ncbi:prophage LambdaSa2, site-specific recombinase, phage integrase family [Lachnospiraceae bacterium KM106-2]|nr:prophage LambdaSa2, site-specific recombinase, phage integrase family [Lachnospiraceae bacterium KM106-2]
MDFVQPIREKEQIDAMKRELLKIGYRNYMMFLVGINTGLRISDILKLQVRDVRGQSHITIREQKTSKRKKIKITGISTQIDDYTAGMENDAYLFASQKGENQPISRVQAYRILNQAASKVGIREEIGTHTLRKTYGYHFYQKTKDVALLQELFNHSSPSITLRYIGINQDIMDQAMDDFIL